jgi:hypothetical protein
MSTKPMEIAHRISAMSPVAPQLAKKCGYKRGVTFWRNASLSLQAGKFISLRLRMPESLEWIRGPSCAPR